MKIPKTIKIAGITYDVMTVDQISSTPERVGEINSSQTKIQLRESQSQQSKEASFLHELIHGMGYALGKNLDEELTEGLAQMLYQVIKDNPEVFK